MKPSTRFGCRERARSSCIRLCLQPVFRTSSEVCQPLDSASIVEGGWNPVRRLDPDATFA